MVCSEHCLVAGNFNIRHHTWQTGQTTDRAKDIAGWASENGLDLLNTPDVSTRLHGNTIDLDFTNIPLAEATIEDHLATGLTTSPPASLSLTRDQPRYNRARCKVKTDDELKRFVDVVDLGTARIPRADSTPPELDEPAPALVNLLISAAKVAGRPTRKGARTAT